MERWIRLWSSLHETALQSAAKPRNSACVCVCVFLLPSLTPPHECVCVTCECVCVRERCGVAPFGEVLVFSPLGCCELNALRRCCSLCSSHPFTRLYSPPSLPPSLTLSALLALHRSGCEERVSHQLSGEAGLPGAAFQ